MSNANLEKLVWVLVYGGLLLLSLGLFIRRQDAHTGWLLVACGAGAALGGAALVYLRSRRPD